MFPIMLFGYTYYKYRAVITKDLMHSLQPIMEQYEKKKKIQQEFFHGQNQKQLQRRNGGEFQQNQQDQILQNGEYLIENELVKDAEKFQNQINNKKRLTSQLNDRKNSYIDGVQMGQIVTVTEKDDIEKQQPNQKQKETKNIFLPEQKVNDNQQNEMSESQKIFNQMKSSMNQERKCSNIQKPLIEEENQQIDDISYQEISQLDETKDISLELNNSKICSDKNKQQTQHDEQESLENDELLIQSLNKIMKGRVHQEMSFFEIQQKQFVTDQELLMISKCLKHLNKLSHVELILNSNIQQNFEDYQNLITQVNNSISDTVALCFFSIKYKINQHKFIKNTFLSQKILKQKGLSITQQQECIYGQQFYWENQGFNQKLCTFAINNIIDTFSMYTSYESLLLNFNRNKARDQNIFKIADNIKNIPLSQLGLQFANSRFTQKGFQCLSELISNQKILEDFTFEISQNEMTKSDCKSISKSIQELQGLKKLQIILNQNKILNEGLQLILEVLSSLNSELADFKLDLSANTMNLETCNQLSKLLSSQKQMKNLEIIVQFNNIQSEGLHKIIQSIPSLENIQSLALDLKGNNLDSNGMTYLSEHLKFAKLLKQIKLDLSQNEQIGDQGIANLSSAFQCLDLLLSIQINLRKCSITHQGIICLVDNVDEKNNLESFSIDIQENMLEESTENKLSAIRHLTSYISKQNDKLQNLELYFNNLDLSENCILCISGMLDFLPQLQKLQIDLRGNKVEEKQKRFLFRSLAGLKSENPYVMISI
ncbi:hypothetical protein ABPG73_020662 [Tetrahymena malaccensis]